MGLKNIRVVLVNPLYASNVGAVCRAMNNMGLSDLALVAPRADTHGDEVKMWACHAAKTAKEDVPRIRKADRQRKASNGARTAPVRPLVSAPFPVSERTAKREAKPALPPRKMYEDAR
jgi:hypothetical protein